MNVRCETKVCQRPCGECREIAKAQKRHSLSGRISHLLGMTEILKEPSNYLRRNFSKWSSPDNYRSNYVETRYLAVEAECKRAEALLMNSQRKRLF